MLNMLNHWLLQLANCPLSTSPTILIQYDEKHQEENF